MSDLDYWKTKCEHTLAKLDDARREIERLTAERDAAQARADAAHAMADRQGAHAWDLAVELSELRTLAEAALSIYDDTERTYGAAYEALFKGGAVEFWESVRAAIARTKGTS